MNISPLHTDLNVFKSLTETLLPFIGLLCSYSLVHWVTRMQGTFVVASAPEAGNVCQSLLSACVPPWLPVDLDSQPVFLMVYDLGEQSPSRPFDLTFFSLQSLSFPCFIHNFTFLITTPFPKHTDQLTYLDFNTAISNWGFHQRSYNLLSVRRLSNWWLG